MTKSQNTKNEQQKDLCITSEQLTEQWKKGELEDSEYYIKSNKGDTYIDICANGSFMFTNCRSIKKVLAPVPSYEEWQKMKEQRDACAWALDKIGDVLVKHKLVKK